MYLNFLKIVYLSVYHLSRLLLLYHDPQLCNHIDSLKLSFADFRWAYLQIFPEFFDPAVFACGCQCGGSGQKDRIQIQPCIRYVRSLRSC